MESGGITRFTWILSIAAIDFHLRVQSRRNTNAAKRLMQNLMKGQGRSPRVLITDTLRSYYAAKREIMHGVEHR